MWLHDLDEFIAKLDEVEGKENQETKDQQETQQKGFKKVTGLIEQRCYILNDVQVAGKKGMVKAETQPSAHGIRIEPRVDEELKQKVCQSTSHSESPLSIFQSLRLPRLHKRKCARLEKGIVTHGKGRMKTLTSLT